MSWLLWIAVAWLALGVLATVSLVGKERTPITPGLAVTSVLCGAAVIVLVIIGGGLLG